MNRLAKFAVVAFAAGMPASAAAQAEYTIEKDPAFPSVIYVEFDPSTLPQIYTAPGGGSGLPVIRGGAVDGSASDDVSARPTDSGTTASKNKASEETARSLEDRAENRVNELLNSNPQELEDMIIDREIEDRVLDRLYD